MPRKRAAPEAADENEEVFVFDAIEMDPEKCGFAAPRETVRKPRLLVVRRDAERWKKLLYGG
jgi:predicted metalloprotease